VRLLLDTAILIWAAESPEQLTRRATAAIRNPENVLEVSAFSLSEIAIKAARGKLQLTVDGVQQALRDLDIRILPYTGEHAFRLFELPLRHSDPFDRPIIAQALAESIPIVTSDQAFHLYEGLRIIW
jgi:PIN domain nuclease of toxin-antitoxin system